MNFDDKLSSESIVSFLLLDHFIPFRVTGKVPVGDELDLIRFLYIASFPECVSSEGHDAIEMHPCSFCLVRVLRMHGSGIHIF